MPEREMKLMSAVMLLVSEDCKTSFSWLDGKEGERGH